MKKLSSFLVLMLIALMLFVSCNGSTPTKEESNSSSNDSSNGSTPTISERYANDADGKLTAAVYTATSNIRLKLINSEHLDNVDSKDNIHFNFKDKGCKVDVELKTGEFNVTLVGSATMIEEEDGSLTFKCNLTEVTITLGEDIMVNKASCTLNINSRNKQYNVDEAIIDRTKVKDLGYKMKEYLLL